MRYLLSLGDNVERLVTKRFDQRIAALFREFDEFDEFDECGQEVPSMGEICRQRRSRRFLLLSQS
jgi:hypothetical protein